VLGPADTVEGLVEGAVRVDMAASRISGCAGRRGHGRCGRLAPRRTTGRSTGPAACPAARRGPAVGCRGDLHGVNEGGRPDRFGSARAGSATVGEATHQVRTVSRCTPVSRAMQALPRPRRRAAQSAPVSGPGAQSCDREPPSSGGAVRRRSGIWGARRQRAWRAGDQQKWITCGGSLHHPFPGWAGSMAVMPSAPRIHQDSLAPRLADHARMDGRS